MPCFAVSSQTTAVRCMAVLLAGYRSSTFFPGLPPQFTPLLNADLFIERRMAGFAAAVSLSKLSSAAKLVVGDGAAVRTFLRSLCETQMLSRLLQRHTSVYLRPFHALCAAMPTATPPSMAATRAWRPRVGSPMHILVVPPPGSPPALALWQASPDRQQARVLPHPAVPPCGAAPAASATAAERRVRKKDKRDEAELARKWTTGEVGAALNLSVAERDSLLALVTRAVGGEMGPHGDDVGGSVEGVDAATSETAALLAAAPPDAVSALLAAFPGAAAERSARGGTALHLACLLNSPSPVVAALLTAHPGSTRVKTAPLDMTPLHVACVQRCGAPLIVSLLTADKEPASMADTSGALPLHWCVAKRASMDVIAPLLAACPAAASTPDGKGATPLHVAAARSASAECVSALVNAAPEALAMRDAASCTPLDLARSAGASQQVLSLLTQRGGAAPAPRHGITAPTTPMQAAAAAGGASSGGAAVIAALRARSPAEAVISLLRSSPGSAEFVDPSDGCLPIHVAIAYGAPLAVVVALLAAHGKGASTRDGVGRMPLHYAAEAGSPLPVVSALLAAYPAAAGEKDHAGKLPVRLALEKRVAEDVVAVLLDSAEALYRR